MSISNKVKALVCATMAAAVTTGSASAADAFIERGAFAGSSCFGIRSVLNITHPSATYASLWGDIVQGSDAISTLTQTYLDQERECDDFFAELEIAGFPATNGRGFLSDSSRRADIIETFGDTQCPLRTDIKKPIAGVVNASGAGYALVMDLGPKIPSPEKRPILFLSGFSLSFDTFAEQNIIDLREKYLDIATSPVYFLSHFEDMNQLVSLMKHLRISRDFIIRLSDRGTMKRLKRQVQREEELFMEKSSGFACGREKNRRCGQLSKALTAVINAVLKSNLTQEESFSKDIALTRYSCIAREVKEIEATPPGTEVGGGIVTINEPTKPSEVTTTPTIFLGFKPAAA